MRFAKKFNMASVSLGVILGFLALVLGIQTSSASSEDVLIPEKQHPIVGQIVSKLLPRYHYNHQRVNDALSSEIFDIYLERLDRQKMYFLASDISEFEASRYELDDNLKSGNLDAAYRVFNRYQQRLEQRIAYVRERLQQEFDFSIDEYYEADRSEAAWAISVTELNEVWRKRLKNEALSLKLASKDWEGIQSTLLKRYEGFQKRIDRYNSEDVFFTYMNAVSETFDPHTGYLSPMVSENFEIEMSLSFEGIGAQLTTEADYTKVLRILPGGPAERSKKLKANDRIVGVAQGTAGESIDVIGMRLDDVVKKIRGEKGSTVRLTVLPSEASVGGPTTEIVLVRDEIILEERAAKSDTVELTHAGKQYRLGVIEVPSFYADLDGQRSGKTGYKSTTRDVRRLLQELQGAQVDGIILDLRRNGGGYLPEAIELSGLFIKDGPVVQVKNSTGSNRVENDPDPAQIYDGPLALIVDRRSASASEIFAAAIQDYGRGVILGSRTFGKGTVQNLLNLNRFVSLGGETRFGQMKVTIAKFYRITGSTTQNRGVIPDIVFPSLWDESDFGESSQTRALPWDEIEPALFEPDDQVSQYMADLRLNSKKRIAKEREFQYIHEDLERYRARKDRASLMESTRKAEREHDEELALTRKNERRAVQGLDPVTKDQEEQDEIELPDIDLEESQRVLADLIESSRSGAVAKVTDEKSLDDNGNNDLKKKKKRTAKIK
jgi:carboxyl-terminal processing protease